MPSKIKGEATVATFATPEPAATGEAGVAYFSALIGALVTLFKLDLSDAQQGAAVVVIVLGLGGFSLIHGAIVRKGRAMGSANRT